MKGMRSNAGVKTRRRFFGFRFILFASIAIGESWGQASSPALASNDAHSITLDVVVTDKSGAPIKGLKAEDFTVLDNKQRKPVTVVEASAARPTAADPVEAYLLIDTINSHVSTVAGERRDLTAYLQRASQLPMPISLVFLTTTGLKIQSQPTREPAILLSNLENNPTSVRTFHDTGGYSAEALREKFLMAMNVLAMKLAKRPGRKLVIWTGPGWGSTAGASQQMSRKENEELFSYEASLSIALRLARITVYSVDLPGPECQLCNNVFYKNYVKGPYSAGDADHNDLMLQTLAAKTGGKVVFGKNDIATMVDECLADAQSYFVLTFDATPAGPKITFHEIRVEVDKPGLQVRTRTGYYTLPEGEADKAKK